MSLTNCRFYEEKYPEVESFVMVNVKQIAEMGAYVKLLEYGALPASRHAKSVLDHIPHVHCSCFIFHAMGLKAVSLADPSQTTSMA